MSSVAEELSRLAERRARFAMDSHALRQSLYAHSPSLLALDRARRASAGSGDEGTLRAQYEKALAQALSERSMPADALVYKPSCPICEDTGYVGGRVCSCVLNRVYMSRTQAPGWGEASFEAFNESLFSDTPDAQGVSARAFMTHLKALCESYCAAFPANKHINIILCGGVGTGKSYLAKCMAGEIMRRGFTAVYVTALRLGDDLGAYYAGKGNIDMYINTDALFIDDLGTEPLRRNSAQALYSLVNERLENGRATLVTTNLGAKDLRDIYGERVYSRLAGPGMCDIVTLPGDDLRRRRKSKDK